MDKHCPKLSMLSEGLTEQLNGETQGYVIMYLRKSDGEPAVICENPKTLIPLTDAEERGEAWLSHCVTEINADTFNKLRRDDDDDEGDEWKYAGKR